MKISQLTPNLRRVRLSNGVTLVRDVCQALDECRGFMNCEGQAPGGKLESGNQDQWWIRRPALPMRRYNSLIECLKILEGEGLRVLQVF